MVNNRTQNIRTLRLVVVGCIYLVVGAGIFHALEKDCELKVGRALSKKESQMREKYNISSEDMTVLRETLIEIEPYRKAIQWDYIGSLYFSIIVLTTIGYGHSVPRTPQGKITCMVYSLLGVPLYLVMFQAMGERINTLARYLMKRLGERIGVNCCAKQASVYPLIPFGLASCILTVMIGTLMFSYFEDWSLLDSAYYCIITLTTIGFGDFVPLLSDQALQSRPGYVAFSLTYIVAGLTIIGSFVNLVVLRMMITPAVEDGSREETECAQNRDAYDVQLANLGQGFDHEHTFLPNVNGDFQTAANRTDSVETNYGPRRKAKSLRKSIDDKIMFSFGRNSRASQFSVGDTFTVSGDVHNIDRFKQNKLPSVEPTATASGNSGWNYDGDFTIPTRSRTMSYNDLQFYEKELSRRNKMQKQKNDCNKESSERRCVICRRSCPVCCTLFSYLNSTGDTAVKMGDFTSRRTNNNENNNTVSTNTPDCSVGQHSVNYKFTTTEHLSNFDGDEMPRTESKLYNHSLPLSCSQPNLKLLLEPNLVPRPRNHSLDSGYEGMTTMAQDESSSSRRRHKRDNQGHRRPTIVRSQERSADWRKGVKTSDGNLHTCSEEDTLRVPSIWSQDGSSSPTEEHDYSSISTSDDIDISQYSVVSTYDTTQKSGKLKELSASNEVISAQIACPEIAKRENLSHPVTCEIKSPPSRTPPRIVVTTFEGSRENISITSDARRPTPIEQSLEWTPPRESTCKTNYTTRIFNNEKPGKDLIPYLCSLHLRDIQHLRERFIQSCSASNQDRSCRSRSDLDKDGRRIYSTTNEGPFSVVHAVINPDDDAISNNGNVCALSPTDVRRITKTNGAIPKRKASQGKSVMITKSSHSDYAFERSNDYIQTLEQEKTSYSFAGNKLTKSRQDGTPFCTPHDDGDEFQRRIISPSRRRSSLESNIWHMPSTVCRAMSLPIWRSRLCTELNTKEKLRKSNPDKKGSNCHHDDSHLSGKFRVDGSNRVNSRHEATHHI